MVKMSDNQSPKLTFLESAAPSTPASGLYFVYAKTDGKLYGKNDAGTEIEFGSAGAGIAATILDAKGDIIAASAADTAARLAVGANDTVLTAASGESTGLKWGYPVHTASENFITAAVTMVNANTYYDGPSLSLAAGTYFVWGECNVKNITDASAFITLRLWDGTNIFHEGNAYIPAAGAHASISVGTYVVLGSTTTVKISGASNQGSSHSTIEPTVALNGTANKASKIVAVRIA